MCVTWNRSLFIVISKTTLKVTAANSNWNEKNNRILVKMGIIRSSHKYKWNYCYIIFTVISRYLLSLMVSMRHGQYAGCDNSSTCHSENFIQNSDLAVMRNCLPLRFTAVRSVSVWMVLIIDFGRRGRGTDMRTAVLWVRLSFQASVILSVHSDVHFLHSDCIFTCLLWKELESKSGVSLQAVKPRVCVMIKICSMKICKEILENIWWWTFLFKKQV